MSRFKVYSNRQMAQAQADALWRRYQELEWAARGLPQGSSLDMRNGQVVDPPITVRYCNLLDADGETQCALPVDAFSEAQQGQQVTVRGTRVTIDVSGHVEDTELPQQLRERVRPAEGGQGAGPIGRPRTRP